MIFKKPVHDDFLYLKDMKKLLYQNGFPETFSSVSTTLTEHVCWYAMNGKLKYACVLEMSNTFLNEIVSFESVDCNLFDVPSKYKKKMLWFHTKNITSQWIWI